MHIYILTRDLTMMHICMMHLSMMLDPDTCMYDAYIYPDTRDLTMMHICMMHLSMMFDPVCMMHISMVLNPWLWCMYVWCIYDSWIYDAIFFGDERTDERTNGRTNGQGDSRSLISTAPAPAPPMCVFAKCALLLHLLSFIITVLLHIGTKVAKIYVLTCQKNPIMRKDW